MLGLFEWVLEPLKPSKGMFTLKPTPSTKIKEPLQPSKGINTALNPKAHTGGHGLLSLTFPPGGGDGGTGSFGCFGECS